MWSWLGWGSLEPILDKNSAILLASQKRWCTTGFPMLFNINLHFERILVNGAGDYEGVVEFLPNLFQ